MRDDRRVASRLEFDPVIAVGDALETHHRPRRQIRRRSDLAQIAQNVFVAAPCCFLQIIGIFASVLFAEGNDRRHGNKTRNLVGMSLRVKHTEGRAPGMTDEQNVIAAMSPPQMLDEPVKIGDMLSNGERRRGRIGIE